MTTHQERLKLANILYRKFCMSFSREWEDLPADVQQNYIEAADEVIAEMCQP